jgi:putative toxin-antitoxin system antitoxin component (TIGR02293 family)
MSEAAAPEIAALLGLPESPEEPFSALSLIHRVEEGLPVASLHLLAKIFAPDDNSFVFRLVPKATLERRRKQHGLTPDEGDRVARLARVWRATIDVWQDADAARAFLFRAHPLLEGRKPLDLALGNELGARLVEDILGRLKYGSAA